MPSTVGERLKKARKHAGMTQVDLAKAVGAKQGAISDLENGRNHSSTKLVQMAVCTGVNAEWLSTGQGEMINTKIEDNLKDNHILMMPIYNKEQVKKAINEEQTLSNKFEPTTIHNAQNAYWLILDEDSMQPKFKLNDLVLISPNFKPETGDYVIVIDENKSIFFRKWRDCGFDEVTRKKYTQLIAHNPDYPIIDSRFTDFEVLGVAIEHRSKLK